MANLESTDFLLVSNVIEIPGAEQTAITCQQYIHAGEKTFVTPVVLGLPR